MHVATGLVQQRCWCVICTLSTGLTPIAVPEIPQQLVTVGCTLDARAVSCKSSLHQWQQQSVQCDLPAMWFASKHLCLGVAYLLGHLRAEHQLLVLKQLQPHLILRLVLNLQNQEYVLWSQICLMGAHNHMLALKAAGWGSLPAAKYICDMQLKTMFKLTSQASGNIMREKCCIDYLLLLYKLAICCSDGLRCRTSRAVLPCWQVKPCCSLHGYHL